MHAAHLNSAVCWLVDPCPFGGFTMVAGSSFWQACEAAFRTVVLTWAVGSLAPFAM
jgi:hypothetical protein